MCLIQSAMITGVFALIVGLPNDGIIIGPLLEIFLTTFVTSVSAAAMGLFVSSMFRNPDRAMTVAPILLMPQILFSGLLFKLEGVTETISWFALCRWSMEGYGTTADLNDLPNKLQQEGKIPEELIKRKAEDFFEHTPEHFIFAILLLIAFIIGFLVLARLVLSKIEKDKA